MSWTLIGFVALILLMLLVGWMNFTTDWGPYDEPPWPGGDA